MKIIISLMMVLLSANTMARSLKGCDSAELVRLEKSITQWANDGFTEANYLLNYKKEIVGFYSWSKDGGMYSEVCDYFGSDDLTVADSWYYWDNDMTSDPSQWKLGKIYYISQDEGKASFKVKAKAPHGAIMAEMKIIGWDENGKEKVVSRSTVTFKRK